MVSALHTIIEGRERLTDVGHLRCRLPSGTDSERFFLNVASLGLPARVCKNLIRQPRFLGGSGRFFLATIQAFIGGKNEKVSLEIDGQPLPEQVINTVALANGRFFGGGMQVAPHAQLDDGLLDVIQIGAVGLADFILWGRRFYQGTHLDHPLIQFRQARTVHARSQAQVAVEADGEPIGILPATFTVLPQAVRVLMPKANDQSPSGNSGWS
jgi:diacylglycerol kinase family enzyme